MKTINRQGLGAIQKKYGIKPMYFKYIKAIEEVNASGVPARNLTISKKVDRTAAGVGVVTSYLSGKGIIESGSTHSLWYDWKLTKEGKELAKDISEL